MQLRSTKTVPAVGLAQKRKRSVDHIDPPQQQKLTRKPLTRANLLAHTRSTTPDMSSKRSLTESSKSTRTTTTDPGFPQKLRRNGVRYGPRQADDPSDLHEIQAQLDRRRDSSSPDTDEWDRYCFYATRSTNEATLGHNAFSMLLKQPTRDLQYTTTLDHEWSGVGSSTFASTLSKPKPDVSQSYLMDNFPNRAVDDLGPSLQPSPYDFSLPRFAVELKAPDGRLAQAEAQAAYDGAIMTEGVIRQREYLGLGQHASKTHALTVTSNGRYVAVQAHHTAVPGVEHHMTTVFDGIPTASKESYAHTRRVVRNSQQWAYEKAAESLQRFSARR